MHCQLFLLVCLPSRLPESPMAGCSRIHWPIHRRSLLQQSGEASFQDAVPELGRLDLPRTVQDSLAGVQDGLPGNSRERYVAKHISNYAHTLIRTDSHAFQVNSHLLPTVTSFIPGLPTGDPFRISIHSWQNPETSRYVDNLSKPSDHILFEARVFIDGRIAG